jgi:hypothetical protein
MRPTAYIGLKEAPKIKTSQWCVEVSTRRVGEGRVPVQGENCLYLGKVFDTTVCSRLMGDGLSDARVRKTRVKGFGRLVFGEDGGRSLA